MQGRESHLLICGSYHSGKKILTIVGSKLTRSLLAVTYSFKGFRLKEQCTKSMIWEFCRVIMLKEFAQFKLIMLSWDPMPLNDLLLIKGTMAPG